MGRPWASACLLVAWLATGAALAQEEAPAPADVPGVPVSDESRALARDVTARLDAHCYGMADTEVPGLVAVYRVTRDGRRAGRIELSWDRAAHELAVRFPGARPSEWRKGVAGLVRTGFHATAFRPWASDGVAAARRDGAWVLDRTASAQGADAEVEKALLFVADDLQRMRQLRWFASGTVHEERLRLAAVEGRWCAVEYVHGSYRHDGVRAERAYVFRYARHGEHLFPEHLTLDVRRGDDLVHLELDLDAVTFEAPAQAAPAEPVVPTDAAAAALARDTVAQLNALHYSLLAGDAPGFEASFTILRAGFEVGTAEATWTRGNAAVITDVVGDLTEEERARAHLLLRLGLQAAVLESWTSRDFFAARDGEAVLLERRAQGAGPDPEIRRTVYELHGSLLACRLRTWRHDGQVVTDRSVWERAGDKAYLSGFTQESRSVGGEPTEAAWTFRYARRDGRAFLKRITVRRRAGERTSSWEFVLKDVSFRAPVEKATPTDPAGEALARETLKGARGRHYALTQADVRGFEARYGVRWKGYAAGTIRFRWNFAEGAYRVDHEGSVPFVLSDEFALTNPWPFEDWVRIGASGWLWDAVRLFPEPHPDLPLRARRVDDEIVVLAEARRPASDLRMRALVFTSEGLLATREERYADGLAILCRFEQERVGERYLRRTTREALKDPAGVTWNRIVNYTYRRTQGVLFPSRIEVRTEPTTPDTGVAVTSLTLDELRILR